jgi:pyrroloquinoline quinone (PQQ) biosynthesis protein C
MTSHEFSARLDRRRLEVEPQISYAVLRLLEEAPSRQAFLDYLQEMYHYVKFSCPLMERMRDRLGPGQEAVAEYLTEHIREEAGHEQWVLDDLESLGRPRASVIKSLPLRQTFHMIGTQLYVIHELNPLGYLGYIYALEANPPTPDTITMLSEAFDIPVSSLSVLVGHAEADPHHKEELSGMLDRHIVRESDRYLIEENLRMTLENLADLLLACVEKSREPASMECVPC